MCRWQGEVRRGFWGEETCWVGGLGLLWLGLEGETRYNCNCIRQEGP